MMSLQLFKLVVVCLGLYGEINLINGQILGPCDDYRQCADSDQSGAADILCRGYESCLDLTVFHDKKLETSAHIFCDGNNACTRLEEISSGGTTYCRGLWGCYDTELISGDSGVNCTGEHSCAYAETIESDNGFITCSGSESCDNADFISAPNGDIFCEGKNSCRDVGGPDIAAGESLYCRGFHSCSNSELRATLGDLWCVGEFSCQNSGTSVVIGTTYCEGQYSCGEADHTNRGNVYCTAERSCYEMTLAHTHTSNPNIEINLYCRSYESCYNATVYFRQNLFCDGILSCAFLTGSSPNSAVDVENDGNCDSSYSCAAANIQIGNNMHCSGPYSCAAANIKTGNNMDCLGPYSCYFAALDVEGETQCDGYESCREADIKFSNAPFTAGTVYCRAYSSCREADIIHPPNDVWCSGEYGCAGANINYNLGIVYCNGHYSCVLATIVGGIVRTRRMMNDHERRLMESSNSTSNVSVEINGYYGASNARFLVTEDTKADFYFNGINAGENALIECRPSATCNVHCNGNGCNKLTLACGGECIIECDESMNIDCPNINGTYSPTSIPTPSPTT